MRSINECEGDRKKTAMIQNAGQFNTNSGTLLAPIYTGGVPSSQGTGATVYRAVFPLILPHSSVNSLRQLPFDVSCLNQSINIRLSLANVASLWQWPGISTEPQPAYTQNMQQLAYANFIVGQQILIDTIASKKDLVSGMGANSNYMLNYYFKYPQHYEAAFTRPSLIGDALGIAPTTTTGGAVSVVLNSFRNASLDSMVFWVERVGPFNNYRSAAQAGANTASTGLNTIPMSNITISYAGTQIYKSQSNELCQVLDYMINETDSTYEYMPAKRTGAGPVVAAASSNRQSYVRVQVAQFSETLFGGTAAGTMIQAAGGLLSNDTLQMTFDISDSFGLKTNDPANPTPLVINYRLNMQMVYQSSVVIERGTARFGFTNPMGQPQINFSNM